MNFIRVVALGVVCLPLSACCFGGHHASSSEPAVQKVSTSDAPWADPSRLATVKKVALVSIVGDCDVQFNMGNTGALALGHKETRIPPSIDAGAGPFLAELQKDTGWQMPSQAEVVANPQYANLTFDPDLHVQAKVTGKPICTGGGYRALDVRFATQAAQLAQALGVDAVALAWVHESIPQSSMTKHGVQTSVAFTLISADQQKLFQYQPDGYSTETFTSVVTIPWDKVPGYAAEAMTDAAKQIAEEVKNPTIKSKR